MLKLKIKIPQNKKRNLIIVTITTVAFVLFSLFYLGYLASHGEKIIVPPKAEDTTYHHLTVAIESNSTDYFIYRGTPMGYQYELLQYFSEDMGIDIEINVINNLEKSFACLEDGDCDIIANWITITGKRDEKFNFTIPLNKTHQVLVQRKPDNWHEMSRLQRDSAMVLDITELGGKTIYVPKNSSYHQRLKHIPMEIGDTIHLVATSKYTSEQLVEMVSQGKIDFTICDKPDALVGQTYYSNIDAGVPVSLTQNLAWAVKKENPRLLDSLNMWFTEFKETREYAWMFAKYFHNPRRMTIDGELHTTGEDGYISPYDSLIKMHSDTLGWDWRLLASLIYQESNFNPNVVSWAGAFGLMQLMPQTAKTFGVHRYSPPEDNIRAGVKYLIYLDGLFIDQVPDSLERIKFIMASYNIGPGHIEDASRLTAKYEADTTKWDGHVADYLSRKTIPKYYRDEVVLCGYCKGEVARLYVSQIFERWEHYKNLVRDEDESENDDTLPEIPM